MPAALSLYYAPLRRFFKPSGGIGVIFFNALTFGVHLAKMELGFGVISRHAPRPLLYLTPSIPDLRDTA
ncbi:MAG: hypothetical protein LBU11_06635 [Zoogloeaceae bacterium]|jgi:hypothetical protein|nr:hypothetical protein [Zoogloeaceae bacterium]